MTYSEIGSLRIGYLINLIANIPWRSANCLDDFITWKTFYLKIVLFQRVSTGNSSSNRISINTDSPEGYWRNHSKGYPSILDTGSDTSEDRKWIYWPSLGLLPAAGEKLDPPSSNGRLRCKYDFLFCSDFADIC